MGEHFLWGLKIADGLTMELTAQMVVIAFGVAVICFVCNLAYNYLTHGASQLLTSNEDKFPDLMEIARCVVLFFCLTLYSPIARTIVGTLEVINEATSLTSERAQEFADLMNRQSEEQADLLLNYEESAIKSAIEQGEDGEGANEKELQHKSEENETTGLRATVEKIVQILHPSTFIATIIHSIAALFIAAIQIIILGIGVVILKILVILGPFVFAVSMLPLFQKQLSIWFGAICSVGMVFTVINILNHIMWSVFKNIYDAGTLDAVDIATRSSQYLALDLALIGAYCSCFWLAGKIVGHGDSGRIISKTVSIVTTAATVAIAGGAMAAGKAATNVGAAASAGKSIISDDEQN